MSIGDRLQKLRGKETREAFGGRFGKNRNTIMSYEHGNSFPPSDFLEKICKAYDVDANWLLIGEGPADKGVVNTDKTGSSEFSIRSLTDAIMLAEEALQESGRTMPPKKKAEFIAAIYELISESGDIDRKTVLRLVKSAA